MLINESECNNYEYEWEECGSSTPECGGIIYDNPLCRQDNDITCTGPSGAEHIAVHRDDLGNCIYGECQEDGWDWDCIPGTCGAGCDSDSDCPGQVCGDSYNPCQCVPDTGTGGGTGSFPYCCSDNDCGVSLFCHDCFCIDGGQIPPGTASGCGSGDCSGGCFKEGSKVLTPKGEINIEDITPGDIIYAYDKDKLVEDVVVKVFAHEDYKDPAGILKLSNNIDLDVTLNHPFYSPNLKGYKDLSEFNFNEEILYYNSLKKSFENVRIIGFEKTDYFPIEYNLHLENYHNFLIEGVVVHNADVGGGKGGSGGSS